MESRQGSTSERRVLIHWKRGPTRSVAVQHVKGDVGEIPLLASWSFPLQRSRRKRKTGLRLMVPNSIALAIRTGSRPVIPEKLAQIIKRSVAPVKMHKWDAANWMLVARREPGNWPSASALYRGGTSVKTYFTAHFPISINRLGCVSSSHRVAILGGCDFLSIPLDGQNGTAGPPAPLRSR